MFYSFFSLVFVYVILFCYITTGFLHPFKIEWGAYKVEFVGNLNFPKILPNTLDA